MATLGEEHAAQFQLLEQQKLQLGTWATTAEVAATPLPPVGITSARDIQPLAAPTPLLALSAVAVGI